MHINAYSTLGAGLVSRVAGFPELLPAITIPMQATSFVGRSSSRGGLWNCRWRVVRAGPTYRVARLRRGRALRNARRTPDLLDDVGRAAAGFRTRQDAVPHGLTGVCNLWGVQQPPELLSCRYIVEEIFLDQTTSERFHVLGVIELIQAPRENELRNPGPDRLSAGANATMMHDRGGPRQQRLQ